MKISKVVSCNQKPYIKKQRKNNNFNTTQKDNKNILKNVFPSVSLINHMVPFTSKEIKLNTKTTTQPYKEKLEEVLIEPILNNESKIPLFVLMYTEDSIRGTTVLKKAAKKINARIVQLDVEPEEFVNNIEELFENSRKHYLAYNQRTFAVIRNADLLLADSSDTADTITKLMKNINTCSKTQEENSNESAVTFLFETTNPQNISKKLLDNFDKENTISITLSGIRDIEKLVTESLLGNPKINPSKLTNESISKIAQKLSPDKNMGAYSDNKIKAILNKALNEWGNKPDHDFLQIVDSNIRTAKRDIPQRVVINAFQTRKWLTENNISETLELNNINLKLLDQISEYCNEETVEMDSTKDKLTQYLQSNTDFAQNISEYSFEELKDIEIGGKNIVDLWLEISDEKIINKDNKRLKNIWFKDVLANEKQKSKLISQTLDILERENKAIQLARQAYQDIIQNDETITTEQKSILIQQQETKLFFNVIMHKINPTSIVQIEDRVLTTLKLLSDEKIKVRENAKENIFAISKNSSALYSNNSDNVVAVDYITKLMAQIAIKGSSEQKAQLDTFIKDLVLAKEIGDSGQINIIWQNIVDMTEDFFNTTVLDEYTDKNIELLNSINMQKEHIQDDIILKLLNESQLSIEQKEFIARYASNVYFASMIRNENLDIFETIRELVFFEEGNKVLLSESEIKISNEEFSQIMSEKFKQINRNAKDINIQGDRIVSKLDDINSSLISQTNTVSNFANLFQNYSEEMITTQLKQLQELISISDNTNELKQYIKIITKTKLAELEKDKYYKEIVPEITKFLPSTGQEELSDFLNKVNELAKKEKDSIRKKKIIKTATIITSVAAAGIGAYYFGPSIVAHLASQLPSAQAITAINTTATGIQVGKKIGTSSLINAISFSGRKITDIQNDISATERKINWLQTMVIRYPKNTTYGYDLMRAKERLEQLIKELSKAIKQ